MRQNLHINVRGFSLIEIMIAVVIISILAMVVAPRFSTLQDRSKLRSARQQIEATIATARAAAIQKGYTARVVIRGNKILAIATLDKAGATSTVGTAVPLDSAQGVKVTLAGSGDTSVVFDPRGFASPRLASTLIYRVTRGGRSDSTCLSPVGQILGPRCAL